MRKLALYAFWWFVMSIGLAFLHRITGWEVRWAEGFATCYLVNYFWPWRGRYHPPTKINHNTKEQR